MNEPCEAAGRDEIGILLDRILAYRDRCESIWKTRRHSEAGSYAQRIRTLKHNARAAFRTLAAIKKERQQWELDPRASRYFWEILPYQDFECGIEKTAPTDDEVAQRKMFAACLIAVELKTVQRLLKEAPAQWEEQRIFAEERDHADKVWQDTGFQDEYKRLCSEHKAVMEMIRAEQGALPHLADFMFLDCDPEQDLKDEKDYFQYDFAQLCDDYSIEGISQKKPYALPQRLSFVFETSSLVIRLPRYLKVDLSRALPLGVISMLQAREYPVFFKPPLASKPRRRERWYDDIDQEQYVARYNELVKERENSRGGLVMSKVYIQLHREFTHPLSQYSIDSRARCGRFLLKIFGVPAHREE